MPSTGSGNILKKMKEFVLKNEFDPSRCKIDYQKELNDEQCEAVMNGNGAALVLAGAGSGKTRAITYRVAFLIEQGISPQNILLVTFTNKASKEMLSRVENLLGSYPTGLWGGTFHSIANRILRIYANEIGHTSRFTILDQEDAKSLIKVCVKSLNIDTAARKFPSPAKILSVISFARNSGQPLEDVLELRLSHQIDLLPVIEQIAKMYDHRKKEADAMDFDDLLLNLRELLAKNEKVRARLAQQFEYVLVDEYQDTNVIQAEIVRCLASHHGNVFVVGDDAQSIYSFRAAEIKNILSFPKSYSSPKTFRLTTNYRSSPEILRVANRSIGNNKDQFKKELYAIRDSKEKPNLVPAANSAQEAQYIAEQILQLNKKGLSLDNIAVLFRAAFHSQSLEFELLKRDIPYEYRGGLKFFERAHVKDIVSFLRVKENLKDEVAWMRILGLQPGVGLVTAQKIIAQIRDSADLSEMVDLEINVGARAQAGLNTIKKTLRKLARETLPADLIRSSISEDYKEYLEAEFPDYLDRLDDLEQFALFAEGYDKLTDFLNEVSLTSEYGAIRAQKESYDEEKIILSTVHQAKGLEWDAVFVIHLTDSKFPNPRAMEEDGGLEEERRLFYVATTRARKHLFFSYPIMSGYDSLTIGQPSMFLSELPDELFEHVRLKKSVQNKSFGSSFEEPTIVFDELGEVKEAPKGLSFLRGVDEL